MSEVIFRKSDTHYYIGERLANYSISTTPILTEKDVCDLIDKRNKMLHAKM